jgi:hypothetical protein
LIRLTPVAVMYAIVYLSAMFVARMGVRKITADFYELTEQLTEQQ